MPSKTAELTGPHGQVFHTKTWTPDGDIKASVCFLHGFNEHIGRYDHVFDKYASEGLAVFAFDQRGFGKTGEASHGVTSWQNQLEDMSWAIEHTSNAFPNVPLYLVGHSMAGALVIAYATRQPASPHLSKLAGVVSSAPLLRQARAVRTNMAIVKLGNLVGKLSPKLTVSTPLKPEDLCRDPVIYKAYAEDPLCAPKGTFRHVANMLMGGEALLAADYKNWPSNLPLLVFHGDHDRITDHDASKELAEKMQREGKPVEFKSLPGFYHEAHNEPGEDRWTAIAVVTDWIKSKL
ncbi:hypothetical protein OIV83_003177 [Microbotryomycetes sp. JL201]|nr:hypothetical protein OIV83_003177 [Microbotryomycetes sp. JL201]